MIISKKINFWLAITISAGILLWSIYALMQSPTPYQTGLITGVLLGVSVGAFIGQAYDSKE